MIMMMLSLFMMMMMMMMMMMTTMVVVVVVVVNYDHANDNGESIHVALRNGGFGDDGKQSNCFTLRSRKVTRCDNDVPCTFGWRRKFTPLAT